MEVDKDVLDIEEFSHECLRNIGDIIEGLTKPYLKVLLHQIKIVNRIKTSFENIDSLDLGQTVDELIQKSSYADLFMQSPWNIRLNHWRNIAYHHSARIENNDIICWYGKAPNIKEIRLSRNELLQVVHTVFKVYKSLKLAYTLFFVDNIKEIDRLSTSLEIEVRGEVKFLNFAVGLASQGFEVVEYKKSSDEAKLVVKDVSNLNPDKRRLHASQFLFPLWLLTRSKGVIIEYREKNNTPNLLLSINSTTCEKIYNGELEPLTLAKIMNMVNLKTKKIVPPVKDD